MPGNRTIRGTVVPLKFGSTVTSGYITEGDDIDVESDIVQIEDENNDIVIDISGMSEKKSKKVSVIPLTATVAPAVGDAFAYGTGAEREFLVVTGVARKRVKKDVERWDIEGHECPEIDISFV